MLPNLPTLEETQEWLKKALMDLGSARWLFKKEPPIVESVLYHCQQSVEKSLKAILIYHEEPFGKTQDLVKIGAKCLLHEPRLKDALDYYVPLGEYAWKFRYPGNFRLPPYEDVVRAIEVAEETLRVVQEVSPEEARL